jgi:hypothetical protein
MGFACFGILIFGWLERRTPLALAPRQESARAYQTISHFTHLQFNPVNSLL